LSVGSDWPKISAVYFGPPKGVVTDQQAGERAGTASKQNSTDDQHRNSTPLLVQRTNEALHR
jgi:hypothetical protein